MILTEEAFQKT